MKTFQIFQTVSYEYFVEAESEEQAKNKILCNRLTPSSEELIEWGTLRGAEILGFDNDLGSFSNGKKPGCVLIKHVDKKRAKFLPESYARMI